MPAKFYFSSLAGRPLNFGGKAFVFDITSLNSGKAMGVYRTEDAKDIEILDAAVAGRRGIQAIDEAAYNDALAKKKATPRSVFSNNSKPPPRPAHRPNLLPELPMAGAGSAASAARPGDVKTGAEVEIGEKPTKPQVDALVRVGKVNPPKPFAASDEKTVKASKRAASKFAKLVRPAVT